MEELYLIPKVVEKTKLSDATVRRYAKEYIDYLPHKEIAGKIYFFTEALMIFQQIFNMKNKQNLDDVIIKKKLETEYGRCVDVAEENQQPPSQVSTDVLSQVMQAVAQQGQMLQQMVATLDQRQRISELEAKIEALEHDRELMEKVRKALEKKGVAQKVKEFFIGSKRGGI